MYDPLIGVFGWVNVGRTRRLISPIKEKTDASATKRALIPQTLLPIFAG
jgi:hypothetical protein